jgi:hypothetical protein
VPPSQPGSRFLLWIDAVGGFLVCAGSQIRLGQAVPGNAVELPLLADLSRHHATILRDADGYLLQPISATRLNEQPIKQPTWLADGGIIGLGSSLRLRFRRPHPLSASARLELASPHQTRPTTAGVLLAAETLVLGPTPQCHVLCRQWPHEVILFRRADGWHCRSDAGMEIDGGKQLQSGLLTLGSRVVGEHFSFSLEEI